MWGNYAHFGFLHFGTVHWGGFGILAPSARTLPMLNRVPGPDNRLARFTEIVASIINSLAARGQLILTGQSTWSLNSVHPDIVDPTVSDDRNAGYYVGQLWVNVITAEVFVCKAADVGAADWHSLTSGSEFSGSGAPPSGSGTAGSIYFDVSDPMNPQFWYKT